MHNAPVGYSYATWGCGHLAHRGLRADLPLMRTGLGPHCSPGAQAAAAHLEQSPPIPWAQLSSIPAARYSVCVSVCMCLAKAHQSHPLAQLLTISVSSLLRALSVLQGPVCVGDLDSCRPPVPNCQPCKRKAQCVCYRAC